MNGAGLAVSWVAREPPLGPEAVVALGATARALLHALSRSVDISPNAARLKRLAGLVWRTDVPRAHGVLLLGAADDLPWADGVTYLGRPPDAPTLLVPTFLAPSVPADVLASALRPRHGSAGSVALFPADPPSWITVPLADAVPLSAASLAAQRARLDAVPDA